MANESLFEVEIDGWEYTTLGEISERGKGGVQTGPFGSQLHASDYVATGIPSIMPQNIGDNRIVREGIARITNKDAERLSRYRVKEGDIIYSRRGDVERRALVREEEEGWLCGTGCLRVRFDRNIVVPAYASFYLGDPRVRSWIVRHAHGATMPNLNTGILSALPFVVPPPNEQRAIAQILSNLDDKIELNSKMNETLEAVTRALFKSWFVDFDPVRAKAEGRPTGLSDHISALFPDSFENSELGKAPQGWGTNPLLSSAQLLSGGTPKTDRAEYWNGDILWASAKDVSQAPHSFLVNTDRKITVVGLENSATQLIPRFSTVVVARGATTGRMVLFGREMAMNQTCYALASTINTPFTLYCRLRHEIDGLVHAAHGSVFDTITSSTFAQARTAKIPRSIAEQFEEAVAPLFKRILANVLQSQLLADIRDTLLPKFISGEIRVGQDEEGA